MNCPECKEILKLRASDRKCKVQASATQFIKPGWDAVLECARSGVRYRIVDLKGKPIPKDKWKNLRVGVPEQGIDLEMIIRLIIDRGGIPIDMKTKKRYIIIGRKRFTKLILKKETKEAL